MSENIQDTAPIYAEGEGETPIEEVNTPDAPTAELFVSYRDAIDVYRRSILKGPVSVIKTLVTEGHLVALQDLLPSLIEQLESFPAMIYPSK